ncbi:hypothetical protein KM1_255800 [Entamoeba histolytica HM-3:IMSS]|uniref:Replication protein n=4 Tax=Entamoeba TaxID=5758 RepID=M2RRW3_ENTHI|nr:hypothetical protein ENU1_167350 [Entamoeba nuttalli P19]EKE38410.1 hypothetical protein ENU1_167350 [Entamoeba nuttalli P19]EMD47290.1 Hypothetical protein EHI5A_189500 [Entamoeba histolytica KU27]EMS15747.1 hypothetical protein KM1_255800 [Entamoeba histolytica HM-3:IMSS]|eukprot:XP_008859253.1 hypothetical protein ENU1_167350 [Entamoeba nuttalli P19]
MSQQFQNEPSKLDYEKMQHLVNTNKPLHFTSKYAYLTLWGDEIQNQTQFAEVINRIAGATNNIQYAHISPVERDEANEHPHQHVLIVLNRPKSFNARPVINHSDGTKQRFWYSRVNSYTTRTGDISNIIKYITKKGEGMFRGNPNDKTKLNQTWINALNDMDSYHDYKELEKNLMEINSEKYIQQEGKIKARWLRKNARRIDMENYTKENLYPWKEETEEIQTIRKWIKCASGDKYRMGNLFIVGPTKTGKTEFAIQEVFMKYNTFMLRGDSLFDTYDDDQNYRFIIFDDINYDKNLLRLIKAITSSINKKTMVNVKYSKAIVTARPCIHLLNQKEYDSVLNLMKFNGGYSWWRRNSLTVFIDDKIYKDPSETENDSKDMSQEEKDYDPIKELNEKYEDIKDDDTEKYQDENENSLQHVKFETRLTTFMKDLGYDESFLEDLTEKIKEARKSNIKLKRDLDHLEDDNESLMEEWEDDLNDYQDNNPLGMTEENYRRFENDTMSKFEKERLNYFNRKASEEDNYYDYEDEEDDYSAEPMEHQPFGGNGNDPDIIYD